MLTGAIVCLLVTLPQVKPPVAPCPIYGEFARQSDGFERPISVAVARDGRIAVVEADAGRVRVTSREGKEIMRLGGDSSAMPWALVSDGSDGGPRAVAFDAEGRLTVAAPGRVATFDAAGGLWRLLSGVPCADPVAVAWRGDDLVVADRTLGVIVFSADGTERQRMRDILRRPNGLAVAPSGEVFVSDEDLHAIVRFAPDGTLLGRFGERGAFPGLLNAPAGLAIAGDCLYVADQLNHRIEVFAFTGECRGQWGMHAVVPREGEGKIHYPVAIAIASDAATAIIAEPFERRLQTFAPSDARTAASTMPALSGVQSHFGAAVSADGDLLVLHEPETASVFVFDLRQETPIHVATFGGAGDSADRFNRIAALGVDAKAQRVVVVDGGQRRLSVFLLARDRTEALKMDPFMGRLARSWTFEAWSAAVAALGNAAPATPSGLDPCAIAKAPDGWWIYDAREGILAHTDAKLAPTAALRTEVRGASGLAVVPGGFALAVPAARAVVFLDQNGRVTDRWHGDAAAPLVRPTAVALCASGGLAVTDAGADRIVVCGADRAKPLNVGGCGISDGEFWQPDGVSVFGGERFVVVDRGNHRAQVFKDDGTWVMTFGLGRAYTRARERGAS